MSDEHRAALDSRTRLWRIVVRSSMRAYGLLLRAATRFGPAPRNTVGPQHVLLTGTFHSENWIRAHLGPLAASRACGRVTMVATTPVPPVDKVVAVYPPRWLRRGIGDVAARLLMFVATAIRARPDVVGGFHLLINGLVAALAARLCGAQSWYFCVGGITELRDGGVWGENPYFARLRFPDPTVERQLLHAVSSFDLVVTMGRSAIGELQRRGVTAPRFVVICGGVPDYGTPDRRRAPDYDLILVARLVPIKRIDMLIDALALLRVTRPQTNAVIVGDGPLREFLVRQAHEKGVADAVTFAGHQDDVRAWLRRARVFVLVSRSEGLALSMMEAMMEGLPAVVPNVGDLGDLVQHGRNGFLIDDPSPQAFAARIDDVLRDDERYQQLAAAARDAAAADASVNAAIAKWENTIAIPSHA